MDDGVPLNALAAELVGIYRDAPTLEDEEYAAAAVDDLLDVLGEDDDEALFALLELPETELTAPLVDDVISMLAETGARLVGRLLDCAVSGAEPSAPRALDALDRMDEGPRADGLFAVLAAGGPDDLRRTAADELVRLGHAAAPYLEEAFEDPWMCDLVRAAVEAAGSSPASHVGESRADADASVAEPADEPPPTEGSPAGGRWAAPVPESTAGPERPLGPDGDVLEAEYRAFLERFERESGA